LIINLIYLITAYNKFYFSSQAREVDINTRSKIGSIAGNRINGVDVNCIAKNYKISVRIEKIKLNNNKLTVKKIESQLTLILKGQKINQKKLRLGFIGLAKQKHGLLNLNNYFTVILV